METKEIKHGGFTLNGMLALVLSILLMTGGQAHAQTGTWSGTMKVQGTELLVVFHLDDNNPTMDSPYQGAKGIPVQIERTTTDSLTIKIPAIGSTYKGVAKAGQIVGTLSQRGAAFPLILTSGEKHLNRPQTPQEPFPYATEEVSFTNGNAVLKGTLALPKNHDRSTPIMLMVTGSGQQNRDEELAEHKPFAVIADALARAGIATLRYDDRGFGESTGDAVNCTTEDLKQDALAGIRLLRKRFDKVGVLGHSEGGTIALMLAADKQADFIVSLAGMVVSGAETLVSQNKVILANAGIPQTAVDAYCKLISEAFEAKIHGDKMPQADGMDIPDGLKQNYKAVLQQIQTPYLQHFLALDIRPRLGDVQCPVLALNGTKDIQVEHASNLGALRSGLPSSPANSIEAIEGVNHLFQHCTTGAVEEYQSIEETIAPEVLQTIIKWVSLQK